MNNTDINNTQTTDSGRDSSGESTGVAMNIFAILGFIAILLAGLWASVQLVKQISNFSFDFNKPSISLFGNNDKLSLIQNGKIATSGAKTQLEWQLGQKAKDNKGATTTLSYKCQKGLYIKVLEDGTAEYRVLPCNAPYTMPAEQTSIKIIPVLTDGDAGELKYVLTYTPKDDPKLKSQSVQGALQIAKGDSEVPTTDTKEKPEEKVTKEKDTTKKPQTTTNKKQVSISKTSNKPAKRYTRTVRKVVPVRISDPTGLPDLTVTVSSVATDPTTGVTTVYLEVANQGTKLTEGWALSAVLPTEPAYTYTSAPQQALYAGEKAEMLLTFDKTKSGIQSLVITVDPDNAIVESLETNNTVELKLVN